MAQFRIRNQATPVIICGQRIEVAGTCVRAAEYLIFVANAIPVCISTERNPGAICGAAAEVAASCECAIPAAVSGKLVEVAGNWVLAPRNFVIVADAIPVVVIC